MHILPSSGHVIPQCNKQTENLILQYIHTLLLVIAHSTGNVYQAMAQYTLCF